MARRNAPAPSIEDLTEAEAAAELERLAAEQPAEHAQQIVRPLGSLAPNRFGERTVLAVEVVALERRRLVVRARDDRRHMPIVHVL